MLPRQRGADGWDVSSAAVVPGLQFLLGHFLGPDLAEGALDRLQVRLLFLPVELQAYTNILRVLGAGGYRDEELAMASAVVYGTDHFTCFQFHDDWRRSNADNTAALHAFILEKRTQVAGILGRVFGL